MLRKLCLIGLIAATALTVGCKTDDGSQKDEEKASAEQKKQEQKEKEKEEAEGDEHPGEEHPGEGKEGKEEHPGEEHPGEGKEGEEEHPGDEHPGDEAKKDITASDIKEAMNSHIETKTSEGKSGVFEIKDSEAGENLELKFVKIHDPVRKVEGKGYFACTDFHVDGNKEKVYDLDFWLNSKDGSLKVTKTKIHKHPVEKDGGWKKKARYTFQDDEIVEVN